MVPGSANISKGKGKKLIKVRTGCITCKIRKVKCGEEKPACKRCTETGRKCDGYLSPYANNTELVATSRHGRQGTPGHAYLGNQSHVQAHHPQMHALPIAIPPTPSQFCSPGERQWLSYFACHTGPALSGIADTAFWSRVLPQMSVSEPAIRHALLAVGSLHTRLQGEMEAEAGMENGEVGSGVRPGPAGVVEPEFSTRHYNLAITRLRQGSSDVKVHLICCLLFTCLECLHGNRMLVLGLLRNAVNLLRDTDAASASFVLTKLHGIFRRLDGQATLFGKPASSSPEQLDVTSALLQPFIDLPGAQRSVDLLTTVVLQFVHAHRDGSYRKEEDENRSVRLMQQRLQEQLFLWRSGLDRLGSIPSPGAASMGHEDGGHTTMLRIQHSASVIYLSSCLEDNESVYDVYRSDFANIVYWARSLFLKLSTSPPTPRRSPMPASSASLPSTPLSSPFFLDACLIPALFLTATKCRDSSIRRGAVALLEMSPMREGLWDAKLHGSVARRVVEIEESSLMIEQSDVPLIEGQWSSGAALTEMPAESSRVRMADILETADVPSCTARVVFYAAPNGIAAPWRVWEEEIPY